MQEIRNTEAVLNDNDFIDFDNSQHSDIESSADEINSTHLLRHGSPFYRLFKSIYDRTLAELGNGKVDANNSFYSTEFILCLLDHILPFFPLWSSIVLKDFGLLRESNASVENWFKIVKKDVLDRNSNISAPRFVHKMESLLRPRFRDRKFSLKTERQTRKNKTNPELQEEIWMKKRKSQTHFKHRKFAKSKNDSKMLSKSTEAVQSVVESDECPNESVYQIPDDIKDAELNKILSSVPDSYGDADMKPLPLTSPTE